jgi:rubrerythrin
MKTQQEVLGMQSEAKLSEQSARSGAIEQLLNDDLERKRFLKVVGAAGAAGFSAVAVAACGGSSKKPASSTASATTATMAAVGGETASFGAGDLGIMNYALTLEHLEALFYREVVAARLFSGKAASLVASFGEQEATHVKALTAAITAAGGKPASAPSAHFPIESASQVALLAYTIENLGASAYLGQAPRIQSKEVLATALSIHSVEARHAATLATLVNKPVTPDGAFAKPATVATVLGAIKPFIS